MSSVNDGTINNAISRINQVVDQTASPNIVLAEYQYLGLATPVRLEYPEPEVELTYLQQTGDPAGDAGDIYTGLDRFGRLVDQRWLRSGSALERVKFGYDYASNRVWRENVVAGTGQDERYGYDGLYQVADLKRGTLSGGEISSPDWQELLLDQWQVIEERKGDMTAPDRLWVWGVRGVDDLVARERDTDDDLDLDERLYAVQDGLNQTAIVDTGGAVVERYGYNAFGGSRVLAPNWSSRASSDYAWEIRFGGYRWDAETGLYQVRYRYLHPGLGRWISMDPIGEVEGINLGLFVRNNAQLQIDPLGLQNILFSGPGGGKVPSIPSQSSQPSQQQPLQSTVSTNGILTLNTNILRYDLSDIIYPFAQSPLRSPTAVERAEIQKVIDALKSFPSPVLNTLATNLECRKYIIDTTPQKSTAKKETEFGYTDPTVTNTIYLRLSTFDSGTALMKSYNGERFSTLLFEIMLHEDAHLKLSPSAFDEVHKEVSPDVRWIDDYFQFLYELMKRYHQLCPTNK